MTTDHQAARHLLASWIAEDVTPSLSFTVFGTPIAKGSLRAFLVRDKTTHRPKPVITGQTTRTRTWEQHVRFAALSAREADGFPYLDHGEAVALDLTFHLAKPQHPTRVYPTVRPDLDKYVRLIGDALTGVLWRDDAQVVGLSARKQYASDGLAHVSIHVAVVNGDEDLMAQSRSSTRTDVPASS